MEKLSFCTLCPRECGVDRRIKSGFCLASNEMRVARAALHTGEEPCICTGAGSGAVFFSGCPLKCVFCQNSEISANFCGKIYSVDDLSDKMLELQEKNAACIDLVSPTPFLPMICEALIKAKSKGLRIPIVYNTSGYEKTETLKRLDGMVDIYLPDLKYFDSALSWKFSGARDYFTVASEAIDEMLRQVGKLQFDGKKLKKGLIIRHLILPGQTSDSLKLLSYLAEKYEKDLFILSLMNQYFPTYRAFEFHELSRKLTTLEYNRVVKKAEELGFLHVYTQQRESAADNFVPEFDTNR